MSANNTAKVKLLFVNTFYMYTRDGDQCFGFKQQINNQNVLKLLQLFEAKNVHSNWLINNRFFFWQNLLYPQN